MARPTKQQVFLAIAGILSLRATCSKLAVGCVLTDGQGRILSTGYNGVPRGLAHCTEVECPGAKAPKGADLCQAVHAEQNALLQCRNPEDIVVCYTTHAPCLRCVKTLLNTSCERIVFRDDFMLEIAARDMWTHAGRAWEHVP